MGCGQNSLPSDRDRIESLEKRVERLEGLCAQLPAKIALIEQMNGSPRFSSTVYDGRGGSLYAFSTLEPFDAKILHYDVLSYDTPSGGTAIGSNSSSSAWPTLRIVVVSNRELIVLNNFRILPGAIKTIDRLMDQPNCRLPRELWAIRASALTD